jgi:uncharacterized protein
VILVGYIAMVFVGLVLGLIGGGGAILTMPILVYLFSIKPTLATSYSLFIVGCSSVFGVWRYHLQGLVDYRNAVLFLIPSFVGTHLARRIVLPSIPQDIAQFGAFTLGKDQLIMIVFAMVMVAASVSMIRKQPTKPDRKAKGPATVKLLLLGLAVGFVAGFVGAGGGFLIIPALVVVAGLSMNIGVATSLFIISANSLVGFAGDLLTQVSIDWTLLGASSACSAIGLFAGVRLSKYVSAASLKSGFGWFVLLMGMWILGRQLI